MLEVAIIHVLNQFGLTLSIQLRCDYNLKYNLIFFISLQNHFFI